MTNDQFFLKLNVIRPVAHFKICQCPERTEIVRLVNDNCPRVHLEGLVAFLITLNSKNNLSITIGQLSLVIFGSKSLGFAN
jgi:hypothetical protein